MPCQLCARLDQNESRNVTVWIARVSVAVPSSLSTKLYPIQAIWTIYFTVTTQKLLTYQVKQSNGGMICIRPDIQSRIKVGVLVPAAGVFGRYRQPCAREGTSEREKESDREGGGSAIYRTGKINGPCKRHHWYGFFLSIPL